MNSNYINNVRLIISPQLCFENGRNTHDILVAIQN